MTQAQSDSGEILLIPEDFIAIYPQFSSESRNLLELEINFAHASCSTGVWKNRDIRKAAITFLVAHNLTMNQYQLGAIASIGINASKGEAIALPKGEAIRNGENFSTTEYGRRYLDLWNSLPKTGFVV